MFYPRPPPFLPSLVRGARAETVGSEAMASEPHAEEGSSHGNIAGSPVRFPIQMKLRLMRGRLTRREFAKRIGQPTEAVNRYEVEDRHPPVEYLRAVADYVGCRLWDLRDNRSGVRLTPYGELLLSGPSNDEADLLHNVRAREEQIGCDISRSLSLLLEDDLSFGKLCNLISEHETLSRTMAHRSGRRYIAQRAKYWLGRKRL